ncbi:MAG: glycogen/starch/alpha-glucan phosphorylase [Chromatiales bacterium]|nr:glycogen/starch/alpha-glucan phosphorylase [Chromatiales bacterium]
MDESGEKYVRMAHLASVGSHADQRRRGAALGAPEADRAARLLRARSPEKFLNVTNGVTPRRWMVLSNPRLAALITEQDRRRLDQQPGDELQELEPFAERRRRSRSEWRQVKQAQQGELAAHHQGADRRRRRPGHASSTSR